MVVSGARCRLFAYGPADATAPKPPPSLVSFKHILVLPFWHRLTEVVLKKRPLNGCSVVVVVVVATSHHLTQCETHAREQCYINMHTTVLYTVRVSRASFI